MHLQDPDYLLVKKAQAGNKSAFNQIMKKYQPKIINFIFFKIRDYNESLDLSQEVFLKAYKSIKSFKYKSSFYTWLYKISINTTKNHLVTQKNHKTCRLDNLNLNEYIFTLYHNDKNPYHSISLEELKKKCLNATNNLSTDLKNVIQLRTLEDLSYEEISTLTRCPIGTVRSRISRAKTEMKKLLNLKNCI